MSSSGTACVNPSESLESVLFRAPSCSLVTPKTNKAVPIRPLKRIKFADGEAAQALREEAVVEEEQAIEQEEEERREALEPRRLDMDQMVALANPSADDEDEEEETPITQPYTPGEAVEEGEVPPPPPSQPAAE